MNEHRHSTHSPQRFDRKTIARAKIISTKLNKNNGTLSWIVNSDVSERPIELLIDCGADITIVAGDTLKPNIRPKKPIYQMTGVTGPDNPVSTRGMVVATFSTKEEDNWLAEIHIVDRNCTGQFDGFLGMDFLSKYNAIIDINKGILTLQFENKDESTDYELVDHRRGKADRALKYTATQANGDNSSQQTSVETNKEATQASNAFYDAVESKMSAIITPKCTGEGGNASPHTLSVEERLSEIENEEENFNIQFEILKVPLSKNLRSPESNAVKTIANLKVIHAALVQSQANRFTDSKQEHPVEVLTTPRFEEAAEPMNTNDVVEYLEERTINDFDNEMTKLKKISLCRLDIGPQAKQYLKYFGSVDKQVPKDKKVFTIRPQPNQDRSDFIMNNLSLQHVKEKDLVKIRNLVNEFQRQFFVEGDVLAQTDIATHHIQLKPGTGVVNVKQFTLPKAMREIINKQMISLERQEVIQKSQSPFNAPTFAVPKKDEFGGKSDSRTVHNFKKLNQNTIIQSYPIPIVWDLIDQFEKCKYFTVLDIKSAYHQIPMNPEHMQYTAFTVDYWKYEYKRMPMGLAGAPATMQAGITNALKHLLNKGVTVYMDDMSLSSATKQGLDELMIEVFQVLKRHNLQVHIKKCNFYTKKIDFLGFLVTPGRVRPNPRKVQAILDYPEPSSLKKLQGFLGMANYYRKFIKDYSHHAKPLTEATSAKKTFKFTPECRQAFEKLKEMLAYDVTLVIADLDKKFIISSDASDVAIGAVLSQGEPPHDRPIQFFSKTLTPIQRTYPAHERECLALAEAIKEFDTYIRGRRFTVITDSQCLVYLFTNTSGNKRLLRQAVEIFDLDFDIRFRPGKLNSVADALSRIEQDLDDDIWKEMEIKDYLLEYAQNQKLVRVVTRQQAKAFDGPTTHTAKHNPTIHCRSSLATNKNDYQHIFEIVALANDKRIFDLTQNEDLIAPTNEFLAVTPRHSFITVNRIPLIQSELQSIVEKIVNKIEEHEFEEIGINTDMPSKNIFMLKYLLLEKLKQQKILIYIHTQKIIELTDPGDIVDALKTHHTTTIGGHMGIHRMLQTMKQIYNWHGMLRDIKNFVMQCPICQKTKPGKLIKAPMQITSVAEHPFDHVNLDFQGPISPKSSEGHAYIFVAADDLTKYSIAIPTFDQTSQTAARCFVEQVILNFGFPSSLTTDGGPAFISEFFTEISKQLKMKQIITSPYTPRSNGNVERKNRNINEYLRAFTAKKPDSWAQLLPLYMFSYNTAVHSTTGFSPFELLYGRTIQLPDAILRKTPIYNYDSYAQLFKMELREAWEMARNRSQKRKEASKRYYDRYTNDVEIKVGDRILVKNHVKHGKYDLLYRGPFTVVTVSSDKSVTYRDGKKLKRANKDHVKIDKSQRTVELADDDRAIINLINAF